MTAIAGVRTLEHSLLVYRRVWRGSVFENVLSPILYLSAMGVAVGSLIAPLASYGGVPYIVFLAPGLLAAQAMQTATGESAWALFASFKWNKTFEAMIGTPQDIRDIVLGHLYWLIVRVALVAGVFLLVSIAFGAISLANAPAAWPAAILTGTAFGMPMAAWTATRTSDFSFSIIFRVVITPLFLFSGTFFPIEELPDVLEQLARLTPLYHGVALTRMLAGGAPFDGVQAALDVGYLGAMVVIGTWFALRTFRRRLVV